MAGWPAWLIAAVETAGRPMTATDLARQFHPERPVRQLMLGNDGDADRVERP
jgi:hypothetical protein